MNGNIFQFEDYLLNVPQQRLQKNGVDIQLPPKVFEVLTALVKRHGQLVTYRELMDEVWMDTFVEETNLRYSIHTLRKTFDKEFIETVPKRGYRFKAKVESFTAEEFNQRRTGGEIEKAASNGQPVSDGKKSGSSLSKIAVFSAVASLMALIGLSVYYLWQLKNPQPDTKHFKTITVLPFSIIGENPEKTVEIQKGLADALVFNLSKIRGLKTTPTNEIQKYFGKDFEPLEIGKNLGSEEVLTGTFRFENNLVRVYLQLLKVSDGEVILTKSFTVKEQSQIELESSIALQIVRQIDIRLGRLRDEYQIRNRELTEETRNNYLTARRIPRENEFNRWQETTDLLKKVVVENPDWALAHAVYAEAIVLTHGRSGCDRAPESARKALEIDSSVAEAYLVLGVCHQINREWEQAELSYRKAIEMNPDLDRAYLEYGTLLDIQRRFSEAEINFKKALELEPFVPFYNTKLCEHYYFDQKFNEALKYCFQAQKIEPDYWLIPKILYWIYAHQERFDELEKINFGNLTETEKSKNPFVKALSAGDIKKYWELALQERLKSTTKRSSPMAIAGFYARLGDREKTLEYLEKALDEPIYDLHRANADPLFNFIRKEKRFIELMKKINLNP